MQAGFRQSVVLQYQQMLPLTLPLPDFTMLQDLSSLLRCICMWQKGKITFPSMRDTSKSIQRQNCSKIITAASFAYFFTNKISQCTLRKCNSVTFTYFVDFKKKLNIIKFVTVSLSQ